MKKVKYPVANMGTVSIMTIFIILCLVAFSALSLLSAKNEMSFVESLSDRNQAYYKAQEEANEAIKDIETNNELSINEIEDLTFPIDDLSDLHVVIKGDKDGKIQIIEYREISKKEWKPDKLSVYE